MIVRVSASADAAGQAHSALSQFRLP